MPWRVSKGGGLFPSEGGQGFDPHPERRDLPGDALAFVNDRPERVAVVGGLWTRSSFETARCRESSHGPSPSEGCALFRHGDVELFVLQRGTNSTSFSSFARVPVAAARMLQRSLLRRC